MSNLTNGDKRSELRDTGTAQATEQMQQAQALERMRVQVQREKADEGPLDIGPGGGRA